MREIYTFGSVGVSGGQPPNSTRHNLIKNIDMTPRQRLFTAIKHEESDYVPCSPWNNAQFPAKVQRIPLEILDGARGISNIMWFWKQQLETDKQFGFDSMILSPCCIGGGQYVPYIDHSHCKVSTEIIEKSGEKGR